MLRRSSRRASAAPSSSSSAGQDLDAADRRDRLGPVAVAELETGQSGDHRRRLAVAGAGAEDRAGGHLGELAPAAQVADQLDRALDLGLGRLVDPVRLGDGEGGDDELGVAVGQIGPDLLGDEGHDRVRERERPLEHEEQVRGGRLVAVVEPRLDDLQVPVAELGPEEAVELERGVGEVVAVEVGADLGDGALEPGRGSSGPPASRAAAAGFAPVASAALSRISREAFHSLFARSRPCSTLASLKRTSWLEDIASRPKRSASAPCLSISSSGSMPVPRLFDIRRPSGAWITEWM